jgi:hypothetical protein
MSVNPKSRTKATRLTAFISKTPQFVEVNFGSLFEAPRDAERVRCGSLAKRPE